jgi:phosphoglucosamine mutase
MPASFSARISIEASNQQMNRKFFGTDGIRGPYGGPVVNEDFAARLGAAAGKWVRSRREPGQEAPIVMLGRDTRLSGESLQRALAGGLVSEGCIPVFLGILPTPAVAQAVVNSQTSGDGGARPPGAPGCALGVVLTASHNPAADNGIKFFGANGRKLSDDEELAIESLLPGAVPAAAAAFIQQWPTFARFRPEAADDYIDRMDELLPVGALKGWTIALDTANGATAKTSPAVLERFGATLVRIGHHPDGVNINAGVGSEHPAAMAAKVREAGARLGIAHDGDGDRCILCDETGAVLDGDEILTLLAVRALRRGELPLKTLVVTVHSNLGVDAAVTAAGGRVERTAVGDRYVIERMAKIGANLGGESSGHIIFSEASSTGDGLVAAIKVLEVMIETGKPLSELRQALKKFPQASKAITVNRKPAIGGLPQLSKVIAELETELAGQGRILVRYSGTEPKIRLLVEGPNDQVAQAALARLEAAVHAELG